MKQTTRWFAAVALLFVGVATVAVGQVSSPGRGTIEYFEGDVRMNGVPVDFGQLVGQGDWIQTGPGARVEVVFDRANVFQLGENTVAVIELSQSAQRVDLKTGSFAAVFDRVRTLAGRGSFEIRSPTTAGGVRGTSFFFRVLDRDTTYVCTCNGSLHLSPFGGESFLESAVAHSAYYFRRDGRLVTVEQAPEIFHSTDSLNRLAALIEVEIPWGRLPE